jgi:signal transduction histidine kinase
VSEAKELIASAIARAQTDLEEALSELEKVPAFDAGAAAFAAHALNNYLTVTGGTIELIMLSLTNHPDPQLKIWLEGLQHATDLMTRTVSQLMSASATSEAKLRFEMVDLPILVRRACDYYQRVANRKTIRIVVGSTLSDPLVWTDRVAVAAVLDNLLSNAIKYSRPNKNIWVNMEDEKGGTVCSIRDEGPGLSPSDHSRLFQRGVRLAPRPTGDEYSRGYGLAVAKDLVEKLGGQIWCDSVLGQGSCFSFRLPPAPDPLPGA